MSVFPRGIYPNRGVGCKEGYTRSDTVKSTGTHTRVEEKYELEKFEDGGREGGREGKTYRPEVKHCTYGLLQSHSSTIILCSILPH